jgi:Tfp pilus assembly PilM family ATPase
MWHHRLANPFRSTVNRPPLGLDIGLSSLAWVELSPSSPPKLERYTLTGQSLQSMEAQDCSDENQLATMIRSSWRQLGTTTDRVVIAIPANLSRFHIINAPAMSLRALDKHCSLQAARLLSLPPSRVSMDYLPLPPDPDAPLMEESRFLVCAAPLDEITARIHAVERAGLHVSRIEVDSLSLVALCTRNKTWASHRFGRRVILQATTAASICHVLQPGALLPDQPAVEVRHSDGVDALIQALSAIAPGLTLLAGDVIHVRRLEHELKTGLQCSTITTEPVTAFEADGAIDQRTLRQDAPAIMLAFSLAMGARA